MPLAYPDYESIADLYTKGMGAMVGLTGGQTRGKKGKLVERIAEAIVCLAWHEIGGRVNRLIVGKRAEPIEIEENYVKNLKHEYLRHHIEQNKHRYVYNIELDRAVEIDNNLVLGIECKTYTDQTMFKRALKEFELITKLRHPELLFCIFQFENALGGDYGNLNKSEQLGSESTHTLMSHSPTVRLEIITLLDDHHKKLEELIHEPKLLIENVALCINKFRAILEPFV